MSAYATTEMLRAFARESDGLDSNEAWTLLSEAASRAVDGACGVPAGFFAEAGETAAEKVFYGDGTSYLKVAPYRPGSLDAEESFVNESDDMPEFSERGEEGLQFLALDGGGWDDGLKVTLKAEWGFSSTPADISFATVQLALLMWRQSDVSFAGIANADTNLVVKDLPPIVAAVCKEYRKKFGATGVFG